MTDLHQTSGSAWRCEAVTDKQKCETIKIFDAGIASGVRKGSTFEVTGYTVDDGEIIFKRNAKVFATKDLGIQEDILERYHCPHEEPNDGYFQ